MNTFLLDIITPEKKVYSQTADMVTAPTENGSIGVLAHHAALFTALAEGEIKITSQNKEIFLAIGGGFMEVTKTGVMILVSRAVGADELNEAEVKKAQAQAGEIVAKRAKGDELRQAQMIFRRSVLELRVLKHHRTRH